MNNISSSSFSQVIFSFKERLMSLTFKQRIVTIALMALSSLAVCALVYRHFKAKKVTEENQPLKSLLVQNVLNDQGEVIVKEVTYPDGVIEKGTFVDNRLEGDGEIIYPNGSKYKGAFKYGRFNGEGIMTTASGHKAEGTFRSGEFVKGELVYPDGSKKIGIFDDNHELEGPGQWFYTRDEMQIEAKGPFKRDRLDGPNGIRIYSDKTGKIKEKKGEFRNGKLHGKGEIICTNGHQQIGEFQNGELHGKGERIYADGTREIGEFQEGCLQGKGERIYADKSKEIGEFQEGVLHGQAEIIFSDQTRYIGTCEKGRFQGHVEKITPDGVKTTETNTLWFNFFTIRLTYPIFKSTIKFPYVFSSIPPFLATNPLVFPMLNNIDTFDPSATSKPVEEDVIEPETKS